MWILTAKVGRECIQWIECCWGREDRRQSVLGWKTSKRIARAGKQYFAEFQKKSVKKL